MASNLFIGQLVHVLSRTWPGINKPGGHGKITGKTVDAEGKVRYQVKYVLGGREKSVDPAYIRADEVLGSFKQRKILRRDFYSAEKLIVESPNLKRKFQHAIELDDNPITPHKNDKVKMAKISKDPVITEPQPTKHMPTLNEAPAKPQQAKRKRIVAIPKTTALPCVSITKLIPEETFQSAQVIEKQAQKSDTSKSMEAAMKKQSRIASKNSQETASFPRKAELTNSPIVTSCKQKLNFDAVNSDVDSPSKTTNSQCKTKRHWLDKLSNRFTITELSFILLFCRHKIERQSLSRRLRFELLHEVHTRGSRMKGNLQNLHRLFPNYRFLNRRRRKCHSSPTILAKKANSVLHTRFKTLKSQVYSRQSAERQMLLSGKLKLNLSKKHFECFKSKWPLEL